MLEIIPNWHPTFVHFTIALLLASVALFYVGTFAKSPQATTAARWNLWIGAAFAVITLLAGYQAASTVHHDSAGHMAITVHQKWAWATLALALGAAAAARWERARPSGAGMLLSALLILLAGSVLITGYLGAENVYRHGIGVMRLPEAEGAGHHHAHGDETHTHNHSPGDLIHGTESHGSEPDHVHPASAQGAAEHQHEH